MHPMRNVLHALGTIIHIMWVLHRHTIVSNLLLKLVADRPTDQPTDQPTDRPTDQPTDIATYRAAIAAKNHISIPFEKKFGF